MRSYEGEQIPLSLHVRAVDDIHVQVGRQFPTVVNNLRLLPGGVIDGRCASSMPNDAGLATDHLLRLNLLPYEGELIGYFASNAGTATASFDLPHFVRLGRSASESRRDAQDLAAVRVAIDSGNAEYVAAYAAGDARALARVYDPEGARFSGGGRLDRGRAAIAEAVGAFLARVGPVRVRLETVDVWLLGQQAFETGIWSYTYTPPGESQRTIGGRYVTVWRRQSNGRWRILADLGVPGTTLQGGSELVGTALSRATSRPALVVS